MECGQSALREASNGGDGRRHDERHRGERTQEVEGLDRSKVASFFLDWELVATFKRCRLVLICIWQYRRIRPMGEVCRYTLQSLPASASTSTLLKT